MQAASRAACFFMRGSSRSCERQGKMHDMCGCTTSSSAPEPNGGPSDVRFWTIADKVEFWPGTACPLMTQSGHRFSDNAVEERLQISQSRLVEPGSFVPLKAPFCRSIWVGIRF